MKTAILSAEHQFILDCAGLLNTRDGEFGDTRIEARYEEFYGHIRAMGRNLAGLLIESPGFSGADWIANSVGHFTGLFMDGVAPDRFVTGIAGGYLHSHPRLWITGARGVEDRSSLPGRAACRNRRGLRIL